MPQVFNKTRCILMLQLHIQVHKSFFFLDKPAHVLVASGSSFCMLIHEVTQRMLKFKVVLMHLGEIQFVHWQCCSIAPVILLHI